MRPIDADAIPWCNYDLESYHSFTGVDKEYVDEMPTLTANDLRKKGEWKVFRHDHEFYGECSECKHIQVAREAYAMNFCPRCGAEMWGHE